MGTSPGKDPLVAAARRLREVTDELAGIEAARDLRVAAEAAELRAIANARRAGVPWSRIGKVYGLTKQGAQQRFREAVDVPPGRV